MARRKNPKRVAAGRKGARARWGKKKRVSKKSKSMAAGMIAAFGGKKKRSKKGRTAKGKVPLAILESRLVKLNNVIKRRGGDYCDID